MLFWALAAAIFSHTKNWRAGIHFGRRRKKVSDFGGMAYRPPARTHPFWPSIQNLLLA